MSVLEIVRLVRRHLEESGRLSYRMLRREFALDDDTPAEVIEELVDIQRVAKREDNALTWCGDATPNRAEVESTPSPPQRDPRAYTPKHLAAGEVENRQSRVDSPRAYTPRHLAEKILNSRSALEGERKQVTGETWRDTHPR